MIAKISLGLSVVLAIAVGYLLFNQKPSAHSDAAQPEVKTAPAFTEGTSVRAPVVAYINGDSLNKKYKFILDNNEILKDQESAAKRAVDRAYKEREERINQNLAFLQNPKNTDQKYRSISENEINKFQSEIKQIEEEQLAAIEKSNARMLEDLNMRMEKYLDKFCKEKGIDYVLNYMKDVPIIIYKNPAYDVTSEVIAGLNKEYEEEEASKKK